MTTETSHQEGEFNTGGSGTRIQFEHLNEPGTYVCLWSGHLLRVPEDAIKPGRSPVLGITAKEPLFVIKLSSDPYIPVTKARMVAADWDVAVNF